MAATYSRVSNESDPREESIDTQEEAQVAFWEARGCDVPREFRVREKFTGMESLHDRPALARLRDLAASGRIDAPPGVVVDREEIHRRKAEERGEGGAPCGT